MKRIIKNFFPQDTRAVEFPSAMGLILTGVALLVGALIDQTLINIHPIEFWVAFCLIVGCIQWYSLLDYPEFEPVRAGISWIAGSFWLWVSTSGDLSPSSLAAFVLGFSNIVAFLINTVILSERWK
jgi:hypothetical protein